MYCASHRETFPALIVIQVHTICWGCYHYSGRCSLRTQLEDIGIINVSAKLFQFTMPTNSTTIKFKSPNDIRSHFLGQVLKSSPPGTSGHLPRGITQVNLAIRAHALAFRLQPTSDSQKLE